MNVDAIGKLGTFSFYGINTRGSRFAFMKFGDKVLLRLILSFIAVSIGGGLEEATENIVRSSDNGVASSVMCYYVDFSS